MASISSEVATGRRMKGRDGLMRCASRRPSTLMARAIAAALAQRLRREAGS